MISVRRFYLMLNSCYLSDVQLFIRSSSIYPMFKHSSDVQVFIRCSIIHPMFNWSGYSWLFISCWRLTIEEIEITVNIACGVTLRWILHVTLHVVFNVICCVGYHVCCVGYHICCFEYDMLCWISRMLCWISRSIVVLDMCYLVGLVVFVLFVGCVMIRHEGWWSCWDN